MRFFFVQLKTTMFITIIFLCSTLVTKRIFHLSYFFTSSNIIYHLSFFIITHGAFDIPDPSSMEDACHSKPSKCELQVARHKSPSNSLVSAPRTRPVYERVMGLIPVGDSYFFFVPRWWTTKYFIIFFLNNNVFARLWGRGTSVAFFEDWTKTLD